MYDIRQHDDVPMSDNFLRLVTLIITIGLMYVFGKVWHWVVYDVMSDTVLNWFLAFMAVFCTYAILQDKEMQRRIKARYSQLRRLFGSGRA